MPKMVSWDVIPSYLDTCLRDLRGTQGCSLPGVFVASWGLGLKLNRAVISGQSGDLRVWAVGVGRISSLALVDFGRGLFFLWAAMLRMFLYRGILLASYWPVSLSWE